MKSIAILHKKEGERALMTLFYPSNNFRIIQLPFKMLHAPSTMEIKGMKIVVITETEDNHLFINTYDIYYSYYCIAGMNYGINEYIEELREELNNNRLKAKYQVNDDGFGDFKFRIFHPMVSYIEGEKLNSKVNFISHIRGSIKDRKIFDLYISEYITKNPLIKMKFKNMKQEENISLSYSTINGELTSKEVVARRPRLKK